MGTTVCLSSATAETEPAAAPRDTTVVSDPQDTSVDKGTSAAKAFRCQSPSKLQIVGYPKGTTVCL